MRADVLSHGRTAVLPVYRTCTLRMYCLLHSGSNTRFEKRSTVRFSISSFPR